jgi:hypothetical protein
MTTYANNSTSNTTISLDGIRDIMRRMPKVKSYDCFVTTDSLRRGLPQPYIVEQHGTLLYEGIPMFVYLSEVEAEEKARQLVRDGKRVLLVV